MPQNSCCVCDKEGVKTIQGRWFCAEHFDKATHARPGSWRAILALVVALVIFVGVVYALDAVIQPVFTPSTLVLIGVVLALVPAAIWLAFFYQQDRLEPEPAGYVLGVFALGALLAAAVGTPLLDTVFRVAHWLYTDTLTTILGGILVVGFTQEFLKYAAVRFSIYNSTEFDEPTDGIIYATAAGLGYATILNIQFVVANGGVHLGAGAIAMAVVALAQASFAGITGYFLGRAKFASRPLWWMPLGLTIAAITNGLFNWLRGNLTQGSIRLSGSTSNPWLGLILAAVMAAAVMLVLVWLIRRNIRSALTSASGQELNPIPQKSRLLHGTDPLATLTVALLILFALVGGWLYKSSVENRSLPFTKGSVSAQVPAGWLTLSPVGNEVLHITDLTTGGFGTTYLIEVKAVPVDAQAVQVASLVTLERSNTLTGYRVFNQQEVLVQGRKAIEIEYVYVASAANLNQAVLPAVVRSLDFIFVNNGQALIVGYRADQSVYQADLGRFYRFLASVKNLSEK